MAEQLLLVLTNVLGKIYLFACKMYAFVSVKTRIMIMTKMESHL